MLATGALMAAGIVQAATPSPAPSTVSAADARQADAVTLPFAPPTGVPIRYRHERRSEYGGRVQAMTANELLQFARAGDGYRLDWTSDVQSVTAPGPMQAVLTRIYRDLSKATMTINLTAQGHATGIANLADWRSRSNQALAAMVSAIDTEFSHLPASARDGVRLMMQGLAEQSDEQFLVSALQTAQLLFRINNPLRPGVPELTALESPLTIGEGSIPMLVRSELTDYQPGKSARIVISSAAEPQALGKFVRDFTLKLLAAIADPAARAKAEAEISKLPAPVLSEEVIQQISLPSGLPDRVEVRKTIAIAGQPPRTETRIFERQP